MGQEKESLEKKDEYLQTSKEVVQVGVCMLGNHVSEEVVMGFLRNEDIFLMKVKAWNDRGGREGNISR